MWLYYVLIVLSVLMFGGSFAFQDMYRKKRGSGLAISIESAFIAAVAGLAVLLIINGFAFDLTPFTLLMATCSALNGMAFLFCSFKALDYINLSLFSLFSMLGGMVLPFLQGIFFYGEGLTPGKIVCVLFICAALACTVERGAEGKNKGAPFYIGIFVLNGMSGVITKIFTAAPLPKASAAAYSIWIAVVTAVISGGILLMARLLKRKKRAACRQQGEVCDRKDLWQSYGIGAARGVLNKVGNLLLVLALMHVDASVQYPMVTGGTMIVSTLICYMSRKCPTKREICSIALAFTGLLLLFLMPV